MSHPDLFARNPSLLSSLRNQERQFRSLNEQSIGSILHLPNDSLASESFRVISLPDQEPRSIGNSLTLQEEQKVINCLTSSSHSNHGTTSRSNADDTHLRASTDSANNTNDATEKESNRKEYSPLLNSWSSASSSNDILTAELFLKELRVENEKLKEVVLSNNESMKKQLKVVQSWQQEVVDVRKSFTDLKKESQEKISVLEKENDQLRKKVLELTDGQEGHDKVYPRLQSPSVNQNNSSEVSLVTGEGKSLNTKSLGDYYWDDLSLGLEEMRQKLDKIGLLEKLNDDKKNEIGRLLEELSLAKETITRLQQQLTGGADEMVLESVREEDEGDSDEDTEDDIDEEDTSGVEGGQSMEDQATTGHPSRTECKLERLLKRQERKQKRSQAKFLKREHRVNSKFMRHSAREANLLANNLFVQQPEEQGGSSSGLEIPGNPRYLRKLLKGRHVANLANGLKLKAFNQLSSLSSINQ